LLLLLPPELAMRSFRRYALGALIAAATPATAMPWIVTQCMFGTAKQGNDSRLTQCRL
jgi:hypothetical protein